MKKHKHITLRHALEDKRLLGNVLGGDTWANWRTLLIAASGEQLTDAERVKFKELTGRDREPMDRVDELALVIGRRGGKSRALSALAVYIAALCKHRLVPGERGVLLLISPDQRTSTIALEYITAIVEGSPTLKQLVTGKTSDTLTLGNISIEVRSAAFRRLRGPTYIGVLVDESAFLYSDDSTSANPDSEILNAVRPGLSTTGGLLAMISSPYAKRGELWDTYKKHFGTAGDPKILVAQATSRQMNSTLQSGRRPCA